jgi:hypothetical protein
MAGGDTTEESFKGDFGVGWREYVFVCWNSKYMLPAFHDFVSPLEKCTFGLEYLVFVCNKITRTLFNNISYSDDTTICSSDKQRLRRLKIGCFEVLQIIGAESILGGAELERREVEPRCKRATRRIHRRA